MNVQPEKRRMVKNQLEKNMEHDMEVGFRCTDVEALY